MTKAIWIGTKLYRLLNLSILTLVFCDSLGDDEPPFVIEFVLRHKNYLSGPFFVALVHISVPVGYALMFQLSVVSS